MSSNLQTIEPQEPGRVVDGGSEEAQGPARKSFKSAKVDFKTTAIHKFALHVILELSEKQEVCPAMIKH